MMITTIMVGLTACKKERIVEISPDSLTDNKDMIVERVSDALINESEDKASEDVIMDEGNEDETTSLEKKSNEATSKDNVSKSENKIIDPEPENREVEIVLYYSNQEYILTGDESLDRVIPVKKRVMVGGRPIEEILVLELQNQPEDDNLSTSLANLEILTVERAENTAYVNISSDNLSGGSLTETLVLQQLVFSLTELDGVDYVQILVDGSKVESLMGHFSTFEPLTRDDVR